MKVCGSDKGRKGYKQRDRGLPTVADGELMLEGWSIVSSKEGGRGKEQVSALQPLLLLPLLLGAKFRKEEGREGLCACGGIFATWAPRFPKLPHSPPPPPPSHPISGNSALCKVGPGSSGIEKQSHTEMSFSHELEFNPTHRK